MNSHTQNVNAIAISTFDLSLDTFKKFEESICVRFFALKSSFVVELNPSGGTYLSSNFVIAAAVRRDTTANVPIELCFDEPNIQNITTGKNEV
jgi:hypothetical protein